MGVDCRPVSGGELQDRPAASEPPGTAGRDFLGVAYGGAVAGHAVGVWSLDDSLEFLRRVDQRRNIGRGVEEASQLGATG
jgi:hypothetical protein